MPSTWEAPFRMVATDGQAFGGGMITMGGSDTQRNAEKSASLASAAHDLPCAPERVTLVDVIEEDSRTYVVDGCGERLTYHESCQLTAYPTGNAWVCTFLLLSRFSTAKKP